MATSQFEYDVAVSFGYKDEPFANKYELLKGRLKVFLYSKAFKRCMRVRFMRSTCPP